MKMDMNINLLKPTVKVGAKNPQFAIYGHVLSLIAGFTGMVFGLVALPDNLFGGIFTVVAGLFMIAVELDYYTISLLKDAMIRGIAWIVFGVIAAVAHPFATLFMILAGVLYLLYHYQ